MWTVTLASLLATSPVLRPQIEDTACDEKESSEKALSNGTQHSALREVIQNEGRRSPLREILMRISQLRVIHECLTFQTVAALASNGYCRRHATIFIETSCIEIAAFQACKLVTGTLQSYSLAAV